LLRVPTPSGSVFLVTSLLLLRPPSWQAAVALASRPIPACSGIQKTFSAGPCSFSTKELWFPGSARGASGVQPVIDSRHGRIACKTLSSPLLKNRELPPPISPVAPVSNTCPGWRRLSKISSPSLLVTSGGPPLPISPTGSRSNPFRWLAAALTNSLFVLRRLREHPACVVVGLLGHHVPGGLRQLAGQRLGG
jgi:hypothetical protein